MQAKNLPARPHSDDEDLPDLPRIKTVEVCTPILVLNSVKAVCAFCCWFVNTHRRSSVVRLDVLRNVYPVILRGVQVGGQIVGTLDRNGAYLEVARTGKEDFDV